MVKPYPASTFGICLSVVDAGSIHEYCYLSASWYWSRTCVALGHAEGGLVGIRTDSEALGEVFFACYRRVEGNFVIVLLSKLVS